MSYYVFYFSFQGSYNYINSKELFGDGIFAVDGDKWRQQRKLASFEFSTKVLRDFSGVIFKKNAAKLAHIISQKAETNQSMEIQVSVTTIMSNESFTIWNTIFICLCNECINAGLVHEIDDGLYI